MQISLLRFVRTRVVFNPSIASPALPMPRAKDWTAMPPQDATGDMLLAQTERGAWGRATQPAFLPFPRHARAWHASRWLGIKKGLHIIRRPANLPGRFVPKCLPRWACCARAYVHGTSGTSETRCTLAIQESEYFDRVPGCYKNVLATRREQQGWPRGKATTPIWIGINDDGDHSPMRQPSASASGSLFMFPS